VDQPQPGWVSARSEDLPTLPQADDGLLARWVRARPVPAARRPRQSDLSRRPSWLESSFDVPGSPEQR
jgi:hypothetical protein